MSVVGVVCALFVLISFSPLSSHTTWLLASRGEAILTTGSLPTTDVSQSLAEGMTVRETSWLSAVFWALVARQSLEAVSWATTILATISIVTIAITLWCKTSNSLLTGVGIVWFGAIALGFLGLGSTLLLVLPLWIALLLVTLNKEANRSLFGMMASIVIVALWANLDASVGIGLMLLGLVTICRAIEGLRESKFQPSRLIGDRRFQRAIATFELSLLATLLTPLGTGLWAEWAQHFSLTGSPLMIPTVAGVCWMIAALVFGIVLRKHQGTLPLVEIISLASFGFLCLCWGNFAIWFAPLAVIVLVPRLQSALGIQADTAAIADADPKAKPQALRFAYSLGAVLLAWIAFAISPLSQPLLGGQTRTIGQLFDSSAPVAATRYLRENPVQGMVFAPANWGDLLQSKQGGRADVFATTSLRNLPQQAKYDYNRLNRGDSGWAETADRYNIDAFIIDKHSQLSLKETVGKGDDHWQVAYEDDASLVLRRRGA